MPKSKYKHNITAPIVELLTEHLQETVGAASSHVANIVVKALELQDIAGVDMPHLVYSMDEKDTKDGFYVSFSTANVGGKDNILTTIISNEEFIETTMAGNPLKVATALRKIAAKLEAKVKKRGD